VSVKPNPAAARSGWVMLALVAAAYALTFILDPAAAKKALAASGKTLETIAPIIVIVVALTALLSTWADPKRFTKHLGEESGFRGWAIALAAGIVSHGSSYVWYPLLADLRRHGVRTGLIVAFLYARAVKIPWLPLMASYFGLGFTIVLTVYIVLGAWVQGLLAQRLLRT